MQQCYQHLHLQLQLYSHSPQLPFSSISSIQPQITTKHGSFGFITRRKTRKRRRIGDVDSKKWYILAMEKESSKFEVDQDKARQALDELDQQLESLSKKQLNPPKIKASSLSNMKEQMEEGSTEISGSFLSFTAFGLFFFTIFYNILFITVIKPAIDGP